MLRLIIKESFFIIAKQIIRLRLIICYNKGAFSKKGAEGGDNKGGGGGGRKAFS